MSPKKISWILTVLLCLTSISIASYNRLYPLRTFRSHDASEKVSLFVISEIRSRINKKINATYPKAPAEVREILAKKEFDQIIQKESGKIKETIAKLSSNIKEDPSAQEKYPYLLEADSFNYFDLTKNIQSTGAISDTIKGSKYLNHKMMAPEGYWEPLNLHPYVGYFLYKIISAVKPQVELMYAIGFTPLFVLILTVMAFFLVTRQLGCNPLISFTASIYFLMAPILVQRSSYGWYDTDPYNTFFPLLIMAFLFKGISSPHKKTIYFLLAALSLAVYTLFWHGWMLLFVVVLFSSAVLFFTQKITGNLPGVSNSKQLIGIFSIGSFILIGLVFGFGQFFALFGEGWKGINGFLTPQLSLWPDLYITVGELHKISLTKYIELIGGQPFLLIACLGVAGYCVKAWRDPRPEILFQTVLITIFAVTTSLIAFGAQRFALLNLVPLSLGFAMGLQILLETLRSLSDKVFKQLLIRRILIALALAFITVSAMIPLSTIEAKMPSILNPIYNDTWNKAMMKIKDTTPPDSIINSWWTPGHFIKSMAQRRVTFDGATINVPQAYWMANVLLSRDEFEAAGLLRMLNNNANLSTEYLQSLGLPLSSSVKILKGVARIPEGSARLTLAQGDFKRDQIDHLLDPIYKKPPPSYLFLFNDLVDNNLQLKFIGQWNIARVEEINKNRSAFNIPKAGSKEYIDFLWELVGGPYKFSEPQTVISQNKERVVFTNNVSINFNTMDCRIDSKKYGRGTPAGLFYKKNGKIVEKKFENSNLPYSVILYDINGVHQAILLDQALAESLFVKLYFFDGAGLKYFKYNFEESDLTRRTVIKLFEVDWDAYEKDSQL